MPIELPRWIYRAKWGHKTAEQCQNYKNLFLQSDWAIWRAFGAFL